MTGSLRRAPMALAALVALATAAPACTYPRTQIVLRVDTDMPQGPGGLTSIDVTVYSQEDVVRAQHEIPLGVPVDGGVVTLPADLLGISPRGNEAGRAVTVTVTARSGATALFTTRAVSTFVAGRTTVLEMFLADRCRAAPPCPAGQTCGRSGACESERRGVLPDYDGGPRPHDAAPGLDATDAPAPPADAPSLDATDAPGACGAASQPCCVGATCNTGLVCESGACLAPCGADGQRCCMGTACNAGLSCQGTACHPCGGDGQPCCAGDACGGSLTCQSGACHPPPPPPPPPCGMADGQLCCGGTTCNPGLTCQAGTCRAPFCGDGICNNAETCLSCFGDCPRDARCFCYVRCCDGTLEGPQSTPTADLCITWSYSGCPRLRVEWGGTNIFTRSTPCP